MKALNPSPLLTASPLAATSRPFLELSGGSKILCSNFHAGVKRGLKRILRPTPSTELGPHDFWALKNIHLTLQPGEGVGLIGRNGSGKTTLLKALAGLTDLDSGSLQRHGRIIPLLNLRTGLSTILSGAENARLYLSLLGFNGGDRESRLSEAQKISGLGADWFKPVRFYSSGMVSRLTFSCVACADADVLLLDEIFSVGDAAFRALCTQFLQDFLRRGKSFILTSHTGPVLARLCSRAWLIEKGEIGLAGSTEEVLREYALRDPAGEKKNMPPPAFAAPGLQMQAPLLRYYRVDKLKCRSGRPVSLICRFDLKQPLPDLNFEAVIGLRNHATYLRLDSTPALTGENLALGNHELQCQIASLGLNTGIYTLRFEAFQKDQKIAVSETVTFTVMGLSEGRAFNNHYYQPRKWAITKPD